jgi:predicted phage terminase large subunit-like protein
LQPHEKFKSPVERHVASEMAREDLYFFARWMFLRRKNYQWARARHHKILCDALMRVFRGECKRLIINIPPRYSKTELAVINFIAWAMGKVPDSEFIHASYSGALATNNSAGIRDLVQHEAYREIFPKVKLASDAGHHWKTTEGGVMYACGEGGTITGFGAGKQREGFGGAIVIDDPHKADEARSDTIRGGVIEWFKNTIESRKNSPDTPIILIMQRLHEDDLAGWLLGDRGSDLSGPPVPGGNGEVWEHLRMDVWQEDEHGNPVPLWPAKHDAKILEVMETASPYVFAGQYRQRPAPPKGGIFKTNNLTIVDAIPAGYIEWVRGWDYAASEEKPGTDPDNTAGVKIGKLSDGRWIVADSNVFKEGVDGRDANVKNTAAKDGVGTRISIPQDPGAAGKAQVVYTAKQLAHYSVSFSPESGDKVVRAEPFAAQVNVGNVLLLRGDWNDAYIKELQMFPNGKKDDQVDASSRAFNAHMSSPLGMLDYMAMLAQSKVDQANTPQAATNGTSWAQSVV